MCADAVPEMAVEAADRAARALVAQRHQGSSLGCIVPQPTRSANGA